MALYDLYTEIHNPTAVQQFYGFVGPHGVAVAAYGTTYIYGNLSDYLNGGGRNPNVRARLSLEHALSNGTVVIQKTPAVLLFDHTLDDVKKLNLNNGTFAQADPGWGQYSSHTGL